jgi:inorganic triphosphatase YgiF
VGTEIELKLAASPSVLRRAMSAPWLRKAAAEEPKRERLTTIYFDTRDLVLRDHGVSLRVRKTASMHLQTIKATTGNLIRRDEWEHEIEDDQPKLSLAKHTALAPLLTGKIKRELRPVFATDVERVIMPLRIDNSDIELAFDRGYISTPEDQDRISEIEIELKSGEPETVAALARRLAKDFPLRYEPRAKAERGYGLLDGTLQNAVPARPVPIEPTDTVADAFAAIGFECLRQIASNDAAVLRADPEGIHQMRVGLRRLRAALSLFKEMLSGHETRAIKADLVWLTEQLGPARDYDVFVSEGVAPLLEQHPDRQELRLLETDLEADRDKKFALAKAAVGSDRYRRIVLNTALWLLDGEWRTSRDGLITALRERPVSTFVEDEIKRRSRNIVKKLRKLDTLSARRRHKLRISVKKMRYACEFFNGPIVREAGSKATSKFDRALKELQSWLGKLNDMTVHAKLASKIAQPTKATQKAFAIGYLVGRESVQSEHLLDAAIKAGKRLSKAAIF